MHNTESVDCVVIGAGVVGIAVARELAIAGREVLVLEAESAIATHTSSRNSEVIHAGIYYPTGSLKANLCVAGREALYEYCATRHIPFRRTGKLIVAASDDEHAKLEQIAARAAANGVDDLEWRDQRGIAALESAVRCREGLISPSTGILDSHAYILSLQGDLETAGGAIVCNSRVTDIRADDSSFYVLTGDSDFILHCNNVVNAGGLWAPQIAAHTDCMPDELVPVARFAKAHYFTYRGRSPFSTLVYPVPVDGGLGVHATLDLSGQARFGPDVEWVDGVDYSFDESRKARFIEAIRNYYPGIDAERLQPGYTGVRPKLSVQGEDPADFLIQTQAQHGIRGLINLFGIESPGLTASLAIARQVERELRNDVTRRHWKPEFRDAVEAQLARLPQ